ncbi:S8 family peptidase [Fibrella forsythiae]|uniref:S8 family serine peptidase n=1 Tax=Fibrella forsythiae TaxID=2817061 RepID=A0ABS3JLX8_9BACT|nr:S8 family peptidase [Fibrella forsythiae]MBO0950401.1 S8 family serine peptidase [Fibrella forsythiae]
MKRRFHYYQQVVASLLCSSLLAGCQLQPDLLFDQAGSGQARTDASYKAGEVLIKFKNGTLSDKALAILAKIRSSKSEKILTRMMQNVGDQDGVVLASVPGDVMTTVAQLKAMPEIEYAEPNFVYKATVVSNDTYFTNKSLWGMYGPTTTPANAYGCQAATAWTANKNGSSSVIVGVIDEGMMITHPDLAANKWVNSKETVNGKDDDKNGYIDDINGWDFDANNASVYDGVADDHGTHVAGTIGASGGNGQGVVGVCWNVKMIALKFVGASGGTTTNAIKALDYLTDLKTRHGLNIVACNNSWDGGSFSQALQNAIERANAAGILFITSAGNGGADNIGDNNDAVANYPSSYPNTNVIAVAAITSTGSIASYSNYGAKTVDIAAPGTGIWSTVPGAGNTFSYASYSGTSMAVPHVTGAVALYKSLNPSATVAQIKAAILGKSVATPAMAGRCVSGGRLSVATF